MCSPEYIIVQNAFILATVIGMTFVIKITAGNLCKEVKGKLSFKAILTEWGIERVYSKRNANLKRLTNNGNEDVQDPHFMK